MNPLAGLALDPWLLILAIGMCLAVESFFSGSEVAFVSVNRARMRRKAERGSAAARQILRLLERPERLLSTTLVGTNLAIVTASFLANEAMARRFGPGASAWAIVIMVPLILVFGEILPKTLSRRHAEAIAEAVVLPLRAAMFVLAPVVAMMSGVARLLMQPFRARAGHEPFVTKEELRLLLQAGRHPLFERDAARLITHLLDFTDARAGETMTPLVDVVSQPVTATVNEAVRTMHACGFSRLPVYSGEIHNIVGVVEAMDLLDAPTGPLPASIRPYIRKPHFVPENARIDQILEGYRRRGQAMGIVTDEYGSAVGILTLEDIIEQIVGEIMDEFDRPGTARLKRAADRVFLAEGRLKLDELERVMGRNFPRAGFETVAGLTMYLMQRIPRPGESIDYAGVRLTVLNAGRRTVRRVRFELLETPPGTAT